MFDYQIHNYVYFVLTGWALNKSDLVNIKTVFTEIYIGLRNMTSLILLLVVVIKNKQMEYIVKIEQN